MNICERELRVSQGAACLKECGITVCVFRTTLHELATFCKLPNAICIEYYCVVVSVV
jgi:hypothetical protein